MLYLNTEHQHTRQAFFRIAELPALQVQFYGFFLGLEVWYYKTSSRAILFVNNSDEAAKYILYFGWLLTRYCYIGLLADDELPIWCFTLKTNHRDTKIIVNHDLISCPKERWFNI